MSELEQRLQQISALVSLPEVYLRLRALTENPDALIADFAGVVRVDPNLTTRLLRVVNSAYFGFPRPVDSVDRAIHLLGIAQLHNMVLGISAVSCLRLPNDILPLPVFWRMSLFAGVLAKLLGEHFAMSRYESLFVAGLLHRVGDLVLCAEFPGQAIEARQVAERDGIECHLAQRRVLGYHYGEIGAMLLRNWNLPEQLCELTRHQPIPPGAGRLRPEAEVLNLAQACALAEISDNSRPADKPLEAKVGAFSGLSRDELELLLEQARQISADMEQSVLA